MRCAAARVALDVERILHATRDIEAKYDMFMKAYELHGKTPVLQALQTWTQRAHDTLGPLTAAGDVVEGFVRRSMS